MVARFSAASLGLLAFTVTLVSGVIVQNPFTVTLSRGIYAMFAFCILGALVGHAAQAVVMEREKLGTKEVDQRYKKEIPQAESTAEVVDSESQVSGADIGQVGSGTA